MEEGGGTKEGETLVDTLAALRAEWGIHFRRVEPALRLLASPEPVSTGRLVTGTGLSYRTVRDLLVRLQPWLPLPTPPAPREPGPARIAPLREGPGRGQHPDLAQIVARLVRDAPRRRRDLDHVAATPTTCLRRAALLSERYSLDGARVLCLGDHDLTSLALGLVTPGARVSVVDVDDDVLGYIDRSARELGLPIRCWFADLKLGLPPGLREAADLVFTDPPYTPEGVRLFAARGCQALRRDARSRLLLCYGYGERQPALGLKVQAALHGLRLVIEELQPAFNRYDGAHAIGAASALYVVRPVSDTWRVVDRETASDAHVYSRGPMAVEAADRVLPDAIRDASPGLRPLVEMWRLCERHALARPQRRPSLPELAAADLRHAPALGTRLLLVNRFRRLRLVLTAAQAEELLDPAGWRGRLFDPAYRIRRVANEGDVAVVEAERRDDAVSGADLLARLVVEHPAAALGGSLRIGLVRAGLAATKNEARARLASQPLIAGLLDRRAADLPLDALRGLTLALPALASGV